MLFKIKKDHPPSKTNATPPTLPNSMLSIWEQAEFKSLFLEGFFFLSKSRVGVNRLKSCFKVNKNAIEVQIFF